MEDSQVQKFLGLCKLNLQALFLDILQSFMFYSSELMLIGADEGLYGMSMQNFQQSDERILHPEIFQMFNRDNTALRNL